MKNAIGRTVGQVREAALHSPIYSGGGAWIVVWLFQIVFVPGVRGHVSGRRRSKPIVNNRVKRAKGKDIKAQPFELVDCNTPRPKV